MVNIEIEMRQMAAETHTLLTRHLGSSSPHPKAPGFHPGTHPPTLQNQVTCFGSP